MNYTEETKRTDFNRESIEYEEAFDRFNCEPIFHLIHASMGLTTEVGEFADQLKRHVFYGAKLDLTNLKEEVGDILWYIALACRELGINIEDAMEMNIQKLKTRYPEKFSGELALKRDTQKERVVLETQEEIN